MRLGDASVSIIMQVVFIIILIMLLLMFMLWRISVPMYEIHGDAQAQVLAEQTASLVMALSTMESGSVEKSFDGEWDVKFTVRESVLRDVTPFTASRGYYVIFSYDDFEGEALIMGDINYEREEFTLPARESITIYKEGGKIYIR